MTKLIVDTEKEFEDYSQLLIDILHREYETPRDGIHLSDLIHCPRQSYFKVKLGVKHNERTLAYFFDGKGIHMALQELFDKYYPGRFKIENKTNVNDILTFTPDVIDTYTDTILEIKTARSPVIVEAPRPDHVEQLKTYMAFSNIYNGVVIYHLITKEQKNLFTTHLVQITPLEAESIRKHWLSEAKSLKHAITHNDKRLARHIADNPDKTWLCNGYCDYVQYCDEGMRARDELIARRVEAKIARSASRKTNVTT